MSSYCCLLTLAPWTGRQRLGFLGTQDGFLGAFEPNREQKRDLQWIPVAKTLAFGLNYSTVFVTEVKLTLLAIA